MNRESLYLVQYGYNSNLSKAEVLSYVLTNHLRLIYSGSDYLIFGSEKYVHPYFGSVLRVAKFFSYEHDLTAALQEEMSFADKKILWSINPVNIDREDTEKIRQRVASLLKSARKKSIYISPDQNYSDRGGVTVTRALRKLTEKGFEFLISKQAEGMIFWRVIRYIDLKGFRERDFKRPYQNSMLSMPSSLARTMVNLACAKPGDALLDPFCGTGTILIEATKSGVSATGVDIDPVRVEGAKRNLEWVSHTKRNIAFSVLNYDARRIHEKFPHESFDCVVTEPPFGPPLKSLPSLLLVQKIVHSLTALYRSFFLSVSRVLKEGGKVVMTLPSWRLRDGGFLDLPIKQLINATNLMFDESLSDYGVLYPITWSKPDNKIWRQICVLKKS
jgi:tRNA G10  N-methylase Trm11